MKSPITRSRTWLVTFGSMIYEEHIKSIKAIEHTIVNFSAYFTVKKKTTKKRLNLFL